MRGEWIAGLDIGGTKTAVVAGDRRGSVLRREQFATGAPPRVSRTSSPACSRRSGASIDAMQGPPAAISVRSEAPSTSCRGSSSLPPTSPGGTISRSRRSFPAGTGFPVYVEHDGNAGALAEWYFGAGKGFRNIVFVTMGTGFGAGLILDGRLYRGTSDVAGEIGHVRVAEDGPDCYGKSGSLEGYGSGTGIARLARMMYPGLWTDRAHGDRCP